jgi:PAS domain S-box-containing protein
MSDESVGAGPGPAILAETPWAELPEATLERLLPGARVRHVPARGAIFRLGDPEPRAGILLAGTARAFLAAADGRQLTVRYVRRGALLARRSTLLGGHSPVAIHALTAVTLLDLHAPRFLRLVETEPQVARVVLAELSRRLEDVHATIADSAFGTVREKVARHLLALTDDAGGGERRVARITQQELADGIGTMREVAARALRDLRREGIVTTTPGSIEILDPGRLGGSLGAWQLTAAGLERTRDDIEAILEATPTAIVAVGTGGEITYLNGLAEATFGWSRAEIIGRKVEALLPDRFRDEHVRHRADFLADAVPRPVYLRQGLHGRRRDGTEFPVYVGLSVVDTRKGMLVLASVVEADRS